MKKLISLALCVVFVLLMGVIPIMAIEQNDPVDITIHYKQADSASEIGLVTVGQTMVIIDLGDGLQDIQYGWSQFDGPFASDDFGTVIKFVAGYIETDVSEVIVRQPDWNELSKIMIPINKVNNGKIEVWVTGKAGSTDCDISYSAPGAEAPAAITGTESASSNDNPATGESSLIYIAMAALALSACGIFALKKVKVQ